MMNRLFRALAICIVAAFVFLTANGSRAAYLEPTPEESVPGPDAQQLWQYISNRYKAWNNFPNMPGRFVQVSEDPHGDWVALYANDEAYQSIEHPPKPFRMKYGSIIVKENYSLTKGNPVTQSQLLSVPVALTSLTVMYKIKGYQRVPGEEEWFWVMYTCPDGQCKGAVATISNQPF